MPLFTIKVASGHRRPCRCKRGLPFSVVNARNQPGSGWSVPAALVMSPLTMDRSDIIEGHCLCGNSRRLAVEMVPEMVSTFVPVAATLRYA